MATVKNNIVTQGLSGKLGNQIVFRSGKGGRTIVAVKPTFTESFNPTQLAHQEAFRQAIAYAKSARDEAIYITKSQGTTMNAFNAAVADWFNKPEVLEIDFSGWTGAVGQTIRVQAQDDTFVSSVKVTIRNDNGLMVEQGNAVQADGLWWHYTTTTLAQSGIFTITAEVEDLPGNSHALTRSND